MHSVCYEFAKTKAVRPRVLALLFASVVTATCQPSIITQPRDRTNYAGTRASFAIAATGAEPLTYQWQVFTSGFKDLTNATNATLILPNVSTNNAADYRVVVGDPTGFTNSATAHLYVKEPETLFISNTAPGFVTLSWQGEMVLLEALTSDSGSLACASWFRVGDSSPVMLPVRTNPRFFRLVALPSIPELQAAFFTNLDKCRLNDRKACEECVAAFFLLGPTGRLTSSMEAEEATSAGIELGSCILFADANVLYGLRWGIQPQP